MGWMLDGRYAKSNNRAYNIECAMRQAAIDSSLLVWGRKHETDPLLLIPKEHFEDFEFHNGYLNKFDNEKNASTHTWIFGNNNSIGGGKNYCDLHVSKSDIKRLLRSH